MVAIFGCHAKTFIFMKKNFFLALLGLGILLVSCHSDTAQETASVQSFVTIRPTVIDTTYIKPYVADIQARQHIEIKARAKGYLERVHVDEGQYIREGELMFTIGSKELLEEVKKAEAALKSVEAEAKVATVHVQNTQNLVNKNVVSPSELVMAQAQLETAQAKVEEAKASLSGAQLQLSLAQIRAPFSGTVNRLPYKAGSLIDEGTILTTLSDHQEILAYFSVPEREYLTMAQQPNWQKILGAKLQLADGKVYASGQIEAVEATVSQGTGSVAVRARFSNPNQMIRHGATGKVLLERPLKNVLVVPHKSTFEVQHQVYVFVVSANNVAQTRSIVPTYNLGHFYVVEKGLSTDDVVIYEGVQNVREGEQIQHSLQSLPVATR
jgi:membrane fusion protein (multidrug efflux system)